MTPRIANAIDRGIADIVTFEFGKRPLLNERQLWQLVMSRFEDWY
jgi:IS1 family transposase